MRLYILHICTRFWIFSGGAVEVFGLAHEQLQLPELDRKNYGITFITIEWLSLTLLWGLTGLQKTLFRLLCSTLVPLSGFIEKKHLEEKRKEID